MQGDHAAQTDAMEMRATAQQYTGPSAARIASLIPHAVSFERGWFRTTTAICHGGDDPDGPAFRQRPDGNGIEVRCHTGGCTRAHIITAIKGLIGLPIWTAYEPADGEPATAVRARRWPWPRLAYRGGGALALALPLLLGHSAEVAALNAVGYSIGGLLAMQLVLGWRRAGRRYR